MITQTEANTKQSNVTQSETTKPKLKAEHYGALLRTIRKDLVGYEIEHDWTDDETGIHLVIKWSAS